MGWPAGKKRSKEEKEKIRQSKTGLPATKEHKENISKGVRKWWQGKRDQDKKQGKDDKGKKS